MLIAERFKPIPEFPGYRVSNYGTVITDDGETVPPKFDGKYYTVYVGQRGNKVTMAVHRLVLMAFEPIDNVGEMHVNHLDGVKTNNFIYNLEWCTNEGNRIHAGYFGLAKSYTPVYIRLDGSEHDIFFLSYRAAGNYLGVSKDKIAYALRFPNNLVHDPGFRIRHKNDEWLPLDKWAGNRKTWVKTIQSNAVTIRNVKSGEELELGSQEEACRIMGLSPAVISLELSVGNQRILPGWWQIKPLKDDWVTIKDIWLKYEQDNPNIRVIKMTDPEGRVMLFASAIECATYVGVSKTNLNYNLTKKHGQRNKHGYIFEYYSDVVR